MEEPIRDPYAIITLCDVCGKPATNMARDMKEVSEPTESIERYEPGDVKAGCDKHPVSSITYKGDGSRDVLVDYYQGQAAASLYRRKDESS